MTEVTRDYLAAKLLHWEQYMLNYELPDWKGLPDLELYMDQVVALITRYLEILPRAGASDGVVTPSAINNYARMRVMPAPVRKKYTRVHLAYLILICLLKQTLTLAEIQVILPVDLTESEVRTIYDGFVSRLHDTSRLFIDQVRTEAQGVLEPESVETQVETAEGFMLTTAVSSVLNRLLATRLLKLQNQLREDPDLAAPQQEKTEE